jgi:molybdopterin molybdotransferase
MFYAMSRPPLTISEAREAVLAAVRPLAAESIGVADALDRILTEDVRATGDVPPFPCSAMDGYAVLAGSSGRTLRIIGESRAGTPSEDRLADGDAIRISTGAAVPAGATAVIRQEDTETLGDEVRTNAAVVTGENIRGAGEDMAAGTIVLTAGTRLGSAELGAAVASGAGVVSVARRPRVYVLCTGDELREPGEPLGPGEIHNSNALMLVSLAGRSGAATAPPARLPDDRAATEAALGDALEHADVLVISGGVSVGPHDHVKPALGALGVEERFWRVSLQPGGPTWFGTFGERLVFGLPGNPVSAYVTFSLFARPALDALQGALVAPLTEAEAVLGAPVARGRREQAVRVRLERRNGAVVAQPNGAQGSHMMSSLLGADALALIPPGEGELAAGAAVRLASLPG